MNRQMPMQSALKKAFKILWIAACAALTVLAFVAFQEVRAQSLVIAGGGGLKNGSDYSALIGDLAGQCTKYQIEEKNTNGGLTNRNLLKDNQVPVAIIPSDLLFAMRADNPASVAQIKALFPLHNEPVHLIVRADVKKEGGVSLGGKNFFGKDVAFNSVEDLRGRQVGVVAGSGSSISARIVNDTLKLGLVLVDAADTTSNLLKALAAYRIDAVVIVGSSSAISLVGPGFKMLPIRGNSDTSAVYIPTKVQYDNMNGGRAVDTLAAQAIMATRVWKSAEAEAKVKELRACFIRSLPILSDLSGASPIWQNLDAATPTLWPAYEFKVTK
jgi:hypothetical protein